MAKIEELRGKSPDELKDMASSLRKELFNLRFQTASGELNNTSRFRIVRRDIARVMTILNDPQSAQGAAPKKPAKAKAAKPAKEAATKEKESAKEAKEPKAKKATAKKKASGE